MSITPCRMRETKWIINRRLPGPWPLDPSCVPLMNTNEGGGGREGVNLLKEDMIEKRGL
jgi:hypothetical protein